MDTAGLDPRLFRAIIIMSLLTLPLKGYAIWRASRNHQVGWFAAMFVFNTLGLIELVYLFYFSKPKQNEHS